MPGRASPSFLLLAAMALLPGLAAAEARRQPSDDELKAAYCLSYLEATAPTADQIRDASSQSALAEGLARRKAVLDRLNAFLKPRLAQLDQTALEAGSKQAGADVAALRAPNPDIEACKGNGGCLRDKLLKNPVVQRVAQCGSADWLPK